MNSKKYFFDENHVRYELCQVNGGKPYNWLFLPGGPGMDSSYLRDVASSLELPGNVWLIDLPGNGTNEDSLRNFDTWFEIFPSVIQKFDNPILVGHSFGGMFPLFFPELEHQLKGFVILNSAPCLWLEEAVSYSKQFDLPDLSQEMQDFTRQPNRETFDAALKACMPYYFSPSALSRGSALVLTVPLNYLAAVWWQQKVLETHYSAKWVPQQVPTLIIGAKFDAITPFSLFEKDTRFARDNITMRFIEDAGHFPWIENPTAVREALTEFISQIQSSMDEQSE
ncbi:MAG: alpha/beta hydrolase [Verrucomicrobia bacterium]|nr:alpha/beta hydrolase [Verrucomicrobiota bacterium]MBU6445979.1 alpha/beta hydrolase [Verrucomicrobiota bacterium]MDE3047893.1 alpha/beta hydrolase [Verrucomicrobiota bacterium]